MSFAKVLELHNFVSSGYSREDADSFSFYLRVAGERKTSLTEAVLSSSGRVISTTRQRFYIPKHDVQVCRQRSRAYDREDDSISRELSDTVSIIGQDVRRIDCCTKDIIDWMRDHDETV